MAFKYNEVVPWGRSFTEYTKMFYLSNNDLDKKILGCGDGPASFNAVMHEKNKKAVSIDPIYKYSKKQIEKRINETYENVINQTKKNKDKFIWKKIKNADDLGRIRMNAMKIFLNDFENGKKQNRYIYGELPKLPFKNKEFDIALCSHFLFLYTDNLSLDFHIASITEMCRVADDIRIFPLLDVNAKRSSYVDEVKTFFKGIKYKVTEKKIDYEFQKGGNMMLHILTK